MELLVLGFFYGPVALFVTSFTGGFAGAIAAGGREDRTLLQNAAIGVAAWAVAWLVHLGLAGGAPFEISIGSGLVALVAAILINRALDRRVARITGLPAASGRAGV
jgi:hypothetical protein